MLPAEVLDLLRQWWKVTTLALNRLDRHDRAGPRHWVADRDRPVRAHMDGRPAGGFWPRLEAPPYRPRPVTEMIAADPIAEHNAFGVSLN
jgi:hypothetical protein